MGVFQPEGFEAVWFPSVVRKWAVRQYRFLLRGSRWSAQEEVVSGGIGTQRAPPSRRFGATDYKAAAEFDPGLARRPVGEATKGRIPGLTATYRDGGCRPKVLLS